MISVLLLDLKGGKKIGKKIKKEKNIKKKTKRGGR